MKIAVSFIILLYVQSTICDTIAQKNVERRHKTKKPHQEALSSSGEVVSTQKKTKPSQRPKTKHLKSAASHIHSEHEVRKPPAAVAETTTEKLEEEQEPEVTTTPMTSTTATTVDSNEIDEPVYEDEEEIPNETKNDLPAVENRTECNSLKPGECSSNITEETSTISSGNTSSAIEKEDGNKSTSNQTTMKEIEKIVQSIIPHDVEMENVIESTTTEKVVQIVSTAPPPKVERKSNVTENIEISQVNRPTSKKIIDLKKNKKSVAKTVPKKSAPKRRINKRRNHVSKKKPVPKKERKTKKPVAPTHANKLIH